MSARGRRTRARWWSPWMRKQRLARPGSFYGDGGTIHGTTVLNLCVDADGNVVQAWFRCMQLPFDVALAADWRERTPNEDLPEIHGVEVWNRDR